MNEDTRIKEWFVPKFGPIKFRIFIGLLFLPYTGMCVSFTIMGSLLVEHIIWDRVVAIALIYGLSLGIAAHAADSIGSKGSRPWGNYYSQKQLWLLIVSSLLIAYSIGVYYIVLFAPLLLIIAIIEGFFVFVYNFESFKGYFHNDFWFVISWGILPVLAGFIIQTNTIGILPLEVSAITGIISYAEIIISRRYKLLQKRASSQMKFRIKKLEMLLKIISLGTIGFTSSIVVYRIYL